MKACNLRQSSANSTNNAEIKNVAYFTAHVFFFLEMTTLGRRNLYLKQCCIISLVTGLQIGIPTLAQSHDSLSNSDAQNQTFLACRVLKQEKIMAR